MAKPCSVFTAAIGDRADATPAISRESRQMAKICPNGVSENKLGAVGVVAGRKPWSVFITYTSPFAVADDASALPANIGTSEQQRKCLPSIGAMSGRHRRASWE